MTAEELEKLQNQFVKAIGDRIIEDDPRWPKLLDAGLDNDWNETFVAMLDEVTGLDSEVRGYVSNRDDPA